MYNDDHNNHMSTGVIEHIQENHKDMCDKVLMRIDDMLKKSHWTMAELSYVKDLQRLLQTLVDHKQSNNSGAMVSNVMHMLKSMTENRPQLALGAPIAMAYEEVEEESWGNADSEARKHFELLEEHYKGFWKCAAEYNTMPNPETKEKMLEHFRHQLHAHDEIAEFVKNNCPALCPEIEAILTEWKEKKKAMYMNTPHVHTVKMA